jgi:hypothetical protein
MENKKRRPGDFFKEVTGLAPEVLTPQQMERAVEEKLGRKLIPQYFNHQVVKRSLRR